MQDSRLKVAFLSLPQRTHAVLEYFIACTGQGDFLLSPDEQSEAAVFDYDNPESRHHWERYHSQLGKPGILLSVVGQQVPMTVWVQKPVTTGSMLEAAVKIKAGAWYVAPPVSPIAESVSPHHPPEIREPKPKPAPSPMPTLESRPEPVRVTPLPVRPSPSLPGDLSVPFSEARQQTQTSVSAREPVMEKAPSPPLPPPEPAKTLAKTHDAQRPKRLWLSRLLGMLVRARKPRAKASSPSPDVIPARADANEAQNKKSAQGVDAEFVSQPAMALAADNRPLDNGVAAPGTKNAALEALAPPEAVAPDDGAAGAEPLGEVKIETPAESKPSLKAVPSSAEMVDAERYCGVRDDIPVAEISRTAELFYPYDYYLVSALREAYMVGAKWRSPTRLDLDLGCLIFVPAENRAYLDFPEEALFEQWVVSQPRRHKVRMVGVQEFADLQRRLANLTRLDRFDVTLWKLGMITAKGRLPVGTDVNKEYFLKSWPNMTRLQRSPFSLRIAALWATRGASLLGTARILEIPQRYVFAFYNAALATDIVTDDGAAVKRALRRGNKNNTRFLNLFKWLRG